MWEYKKNRNTFFQSHADTLAIIGVNLAIGALILNLTLAHGSDISACNARIDTTNKRIDNTITMFYELLKEVRK